MNGNSRRVAEVSYRGYAHRKLDKPSAFAPASNDHQGNRQQDTQETEAAPVVRLHDADLDRLAEAIALKLECLLAHTSSGTTLLDRPEMAAFLNISLATLDRLVTADEIPSVQVGTRRLFDKIKVLAQLSASQTA